MRILLFKITFFLIFYTNTVIERKIVSHQINTSQNIYKNNNKKYIFCFCLFLVLGHVANLLYYRHLDVPIEKYLTLNPRQFCIFYKLTWIDFKNMFKGGSLKIANEILAVKKNDLEQKAQEIVEKMRKIKRTGAFHIKSLKELYEEWRMYIKIMYLAYPELLLLARGARAQKNDYLIVFNIIENINRLVDNEYYFPKSSRVMQMLWE